MPPTGGGSAATAVIDAGHLACELVAVLDGTSTIPIATRRFQQAMAGYAPDRVREALGLLRQIRRLPHPIVSGAARIGLPAVAAPHRMSSGTVRSCSPGPGDRPPGIESQESAVRTAHP